MNITPAEFKKAMIKQEQDQIYHIRAYIGANLIRTANKTEERVKKILEKEMHKSQQNLKSLEGLHAGNDALEIEIKEMKAGLKVIDEM